MKILSVAVPCYNSQEYMRKCVDSLLKGGEDVEILIVDDGSKDDTLKIARDYEEKYPTIVKAIHQENKGHGGAVNTGLAHATGLYFKVVDSDDWLNEEALKKALEVLKLCVRGPKTLDLLLCNYVYEKVGAKRKTVMRYRSALPQDKIFGWDDVKPLGTSPLSADAFDDLQDRASAGMWSETAGAYILCGQSGGIYSAGECAEHVLSGCKSVPLFYRKSRSVR